jgi:AraC-like DNA-binding protein
MVEISQIELPENRTRSDEWALKAASAYRYFHRDQLNLPSVRLPSAIQIVYFPGSGADSFFFGQDRENIVADYVFVVPPGMPFGVVGEKNGAVDCVHIQAIGSPPAGLSLPAKLRVHSPAVSGALLDMAAEYARGGAVTTSLGGLFEALLNSRAAVRVTFADHAEGRPPRDTARHSHREEHQIDYYLKAKGRFWLADRWHEIADGHLFYIPPGVEHAIELDPAAPYHNLSLKFIPDEALQGQVRGEAARIEAGHNAQELRRAMQQITASYLLYAPVASDDVGRVLALVAEAAEAAEGGARPHARTSKVDLARQIVASNYSLPIRLDWVARRLGLSPAYLSRAFRERAGETFSAHLRRVRVARAAALLRDSSLTVGEIARQCGFATIHYFSQTFRRETGRTPTDVRRGRGGKA